jgi:hypothetical protein
MLRDSLPLLRPAERLCVVRIARPDGIPSERSATRVITVEWGSLPLRAETESLHNLELAFNSSNRELVML